MRQLCIGIAAVCTVALSSTVVAETSSAAKDQFYTENYGTYSKQEATVAGETQATSATKKAQNAEKRRLQRQANAEKRALRRQENAKKREIRRQKRMEQIAKRKAANEARKLRREERLLARQNKPATTATPTTTVASKPATPVALSKPIVRPAPVAVTPAPIAYVPPTPVVVAPAPVPETPRVGNAVVRWSVPARREDGSALNARDIQGYEIYLTSENLESTSTIRIPNSQQTQYRFDNLTADDYHFSMVTIDSNGTYSELSPVVSKSID